jgi:hypothetical protein
LRSLLSRVWNSPTYTTWGSVFANSISAVVVLPLVLTRLGSAEIALWYLMITFVGFQFVVGFGFSPTFSRIITYVMSGVRTDQLRRPPASGSGGTGNFDRRDLNRVYSTMSTVYFRLGLLWTLFLIFVGTLTLKRPVYQSVDPNSAWQAWAVIVAVSYVSFVGDKYASYLMGLNQVALLRRWETISALGAIATSFLVLVFNGGLLGLVIANQAWQLLRVGLNRQLARSASNGLMKGFRKEPFDKEIFSAIWASAWRSGIGVLMSYGVIQSSGIIYAQVGSAASVASYLLGMRIMQIITQFSAAPFYGKIPVYSALYAEGKKAELVHVAQRSMRLSHWTFVVAFAAAAFIAPPFLSHIGSNVAFPNPLLWTLMGLGFFAERFGAMHIQLYSTTNHIVWHIANGIGGFIYLVVSLALLKAIGVYAFPVGIIAGYYGFYSWYSAGHSFREFGIKAIAFEKSNSLVPYAVLLVTCAVLLISQEVLVR